MNNFIVGEKVRIKNKEWFEENYPGYEDGFPYYEHGWHPRMNDLFGTECEINETGYDEGEVPYIIIETPDDYKFYYNPEDVEAIPNTPPDPPSKKYKVKQKIIQDI